MSRYLADVFALLSLAGCIAFCLLVFPPAALIVASVYLALLAVLAYRAEGKSE